MRFISIGSNAVINPEQITQIATIDEKGDLLVILADGSQLTFEDDTAGEFLRYFDEHHFNQAPALLEIRNSFNP